MPTRGSSTVTSAELREGCVRVAAGTIVEVGEGPEPGDRVIDCRGRTIIPGLIDAHFHAYAAGLSLREIETSPLSYLALAGARRLAGALGRGFTTVRDPGGGDAGLARAVPRGPDGGSEVPVLRARAEPDRRPWRSAAAGAGLDGEQLHGLRLQAEVEGPLAVLRAATSVNAELLGRDDLGRIGPGAVADLLILDGDPLRDPSVLWGAPERRAVGGPLLVGLVPAVRQVEGVAVQSLLVAEFPDGPPGPAAGWPQRRRTLGWFLLHVFTGALVVAAVLGLIALAGSWWTVPAAVATVLGTLLAGRFLAWLGPVLLGPSYAERLQRLEADAARATERNRIAREIHDSVGHALSVVTVQASAARKLIERDPGFAADALATIETASRRAASELDEMLGLLRDETRRPAAPAPGLDSLDGLLTMARSAGLTVDATVPGDLSRLPPPVSQEAYRIVQEGLTNALKYSADGTATLAVSFGRATLDICLSNPAGGRRTARGGRGLRGIDERAAALGGTASAGPRGGRWTLSVALPAREVPP